MQTTELKIVLTRGNNVNSGEAIAACLLSWYTEEGEKLQVSKIIHGDKSNVRQQMERLFNRLLNELPEV